MSTSPPTDDPVYWLRRAQTAPSVTLQQSAWCVYEGLCWLAYVNRFPLPALAQRQLTDHERYAIFRAQEAVRR